MKKAKKKKDEYRRALTALPYVRGYSPFMLTKGNKVVNPSVKDVRKLFPHLRESTIAQLLKQAQEADCHHAVVAAPPLRVHGAFHPIAIMKSLRSKGQVVVFKWAMGAFTGTCYECFFSEESFTKERRFFSPPSFSGYRRILPNIKKTRRAGNTPVKFHKAAIDQGAAWGTEKIHWYSGWVGMGRKEHLVCIAPTEDGACIVEVSEHEMEQYELQGGVSPDFTAHFERRKFYWRNARGVPDNVAAFLNNLTRDDLKSAIK